MHGEYRVLSNNDPGILCQFIFDPVENNVEYSIWKLISAQILAMHGENNALLPSRADDKAAAILDGSVRIADAIAKHFRDPCLDLSSRAADRTKSQIRTVPEFGNFQPVQ